MNNTLFDLHHLSSNILFNGQFRESLVYLIENSVSLLVLQQEMLHVKHTFCECLQLSQSFLYFLSISGGAFVHIFHKLLYVFADLNLKGEKPNFWVLCYKQ